MIKNIHIVAFLLQLAGLILYSFISGELFLSLFNNSTYLFLGYLLIYLSLLTIHARFFDGFLFGMHRVFRSKRRPGSMETTFIPASEKVNVKALSFFKSQTIFFLMTNLVLLMIYLLN